MSAAEAMLSQQIRLHALLANGGEHARAAVRTGTITSYDRVNYAVKVMLEPEGIETGWLPLGAEHASNGAGILSGPMTGDQVVLGHVLNDPETMVVLTRAYSDVDRPPKGPAGVGPPAGAVWMYDSSGTSVRLTGGGKLAADAPSTVASGPVHSEQLVTSGAAPSGVITTSTGAVVHYQHGAVTVGAGSSINPAFFTAAAARILAAETCAEVSAYEAEALASVTQLQGDMGSALSVLGPVVALSKLNISDLPSVITFLTQFVSVVLGPQVAAEVALTAQLAELATKIPQITAAAVTAAERCVPAIP